MRPNSEFVLWVSRKCPKLLVKMLIRVRPILQSLDREILVGGCIEMYFQKFYEQHRYLPLGRWLWISVVSINKVSEVSWRIA
jgi:hypothetical protein